MSCRSFIPLLLLTTACRTVEPLSYQQHLEQRTGLVADQADAQDGVLSKNHRGYPLLVRTHMGDVWGRSGARLAMGESGRVLGRVGGFLTGQQGAVGGITGSPLDRALSRIIGQPLSLFVVLKHGKVGAPALDIVSGSSTITPTRTLPKLGTLGRVFGETVSGTDPAFWRRIEEAPDLTRALTSFRSYYVLVDERAVTFMFAGSENEYSAMVRAYPSYEDFLIAVMDTLAGIADRI